MATDFTRGIKVYIDSQLYGKSMKEMTAHLAKYRLELQNLINQGKQSTKEADRVRQSIQRLEKTQQSYEQELRETKLVLSNLSGATYNQLIAAQRRLKAQLRELSPQTREYRQLLETLRQTQTRLTLVTNEMNKTYADQRGLLARLSSTLNKYFLVISTVVSSMVALIMAGRKAVEAYMEVEEALAKIRKYAGLTVEDVHRLSSELSNLENVNTRTSHLALLELAADAGRLGIKGVENLKNFVVAADKINLALGEDLGKDAVTNIGKLANLFGEDRRIGLEEAMLSTASAVTKLAKSSTACEPYLVNFASRLGGIGAVAGITTGDILGLGSALDQNMQKVEMSSTALATLITKIFQEPMKFAQLAGIEVERFTEMVKTDANEALLLFLTSMNERGGFDKLAPMFSDMEMSGKRAVQVLSTLASHVDQVREAQVIANDAYEKNLEVEHEFQIINNTTQAQLDKAKKRLQELRVELGEKLRPALVHIKTTQSLLLRSLKIIIDFLSEHRALISSLTIDVIALTTAYKLHVIQQKLVVLWNDKIIRGLRRLMIVIKKNPWAVLATSLAVVIGKIIDYTRRQREARMEAESLDDIMRKAALSVDSQVDSLKSLLTVLSEEDLSYERKMAALNDIISMNPEFLGVLASEKTSYEDASRAVANYIRYLKKQAEMEALIEKGDNIRAAMVELLEDENDPSSIKQEGPVKMAFRDILYRIRASNRAEFSPVTYDDGSGNQVTYRELTRERRKEVRMNYLEEEYSQSGLPHIRYQELMLESLEVQEMVKLMQKQLTDMLLDAQVASTRVAETLSTAISPDDIKDTYEGEGGIIETIETEYDALQHSLEMSLARRQISQEEYDIRSSSLESQHQTALLSAYRSYQSALSSLQFDSDESREKALSSVHKKELEAERAHEKAMVDVRDSLSRALEGLMKSDLKSETDEFEKLSQEYDKRKSLAYDYYSSITSFIIMNVKETGLALTMMNAAETAFFNSLQRLSAWYDSERSTLDFEQAKKHYQLLKKYGFESLSTELQFELEQLDRTYEAGLLSEEEYLRARSYLIDKYEEEDRISRIRAKEQFLKLSYKEQMALELDNLDAIHRKGLLSEQDYQRARRQIILDSAMNTYSELSSQAVTAMQSLESMEIAAVEKKYEILLREAENNGEDTTKLEMEQANAKLEIQKKYALSNLLVKLSQITADTAVAIMTGFAQLGPVAGAVAAAMLSATGLAQYGAAYSEYDKIRSISLQSSPVSTQTVDTGKRVVQYASGKYDVIGEDDGRTYRSVPYIGSDVTGIVERPALISERGAELIVSAPVLERLRQRSDFSLIASAINDARLGVVRQHEKGSYSQLPTVTSSKEDNTELLSAVLSIARQIESLPREQRSYVLLSDLNRSQELSLKASEPFRRKDNHTR